MGGKKHKGKKQAWGEKNIPVFFPFFPGPVFSPSFKKGPHHFRNFFEMKEFDVPTQTSY
jgi:hypothetical protein